MYIDIFYSYLLIENSGYVRVYVMDVLSRCGEIRLDLI